VLGQNMPLWKMVLPAGIIHGMANFRGMKVRYHLSIDRLLLLSSLTMLTTPDPQ
jgi:hypothetical protein